MIRTVTILLALALLGCTEKRAEPCDSKRADELVARLDAADPYERARIVEREIDDVCEFPTLFIEDGYHGNQLTDVGLEVFDRVCIHESAIDRKPAPRELDQFYDACGFARLGVVSRSEYQLQPYAHPLAWVGHQWMLDNGLSADQVRPITRAWLLRDRAAASFERLEDLRLPAIEGDREFEGVLVQISPTRIKVVDDVFGHDELARVSTALEEDADIGRAIAEAMDQPWHGSLVVAADVDAPRAIVSEVILAASRLGYTRVVTLGEVEPLVYTAQPLRNP